MRVDMIDLEHNRYLLNKNLGNLENKKIVIYGTGEIAKGILSILPFNSVVGIWDNTLDGGIWNGKKLLSQEEIALLQTDVIIVAADLMYCRTIFSNICNFCNNYGIVLCNLFGMNLFKLYGTVVKQEICYWNMTKELLMQEINSHDVISFDVFDTLIMRTVLFPSDVYHIMSDKIKNMNIGIDDYFNLRGRAEFEYPCVSPDIYQIYGLLQKMSNISDEDRIQIMNMELGMEEEVIIPRRDMIETMNYAKEKGKKVCLISDMYIPTDILSEILRNKDITNYDKLYVSCDYHRTKLNNLYKVFMDEQQGSSYLHIGDNVTADGIGALTYGIDIFMIKKAEDILRLNDTSDFRSFSLEERNRIGLKISELYNSPFSVCL